ncbi:hypothetical protein [Desulforamulus reducens]|uniref:hypothetical protein n=1 Tax=Desulforamulus reducens TaxID=59610 RepID=UPI0002E08276|nr:hypothetical protein [Desulforamulus reducens]
MAEVKIRDINQPMRTSQQIDYEDEWFELQPIEKKLIAYSLTLGLSLLLLFIFIFKPFH